ncbi:hypothetical protein [Gordonia sp. MP11Mi]|uniref:Uncharacterized protein n=1 Tax=Gordonia sp. MP11Mi TaxID=3022769 RepID=A0AA97GVG7_9ACTN
MTFVIAKIVDRETGQIMLLADSKVTHRNNDRLTRNSLVNPIQKVVIVNDDTVVGFAGDNPDLATQKLVELRKTSTNQIESTLQRYSLQKYSERGATTRFLVAIRKPSPRIVEVSNGKIDDRTIIGTGWIGDYEAFRAYTRTYHDLEDMDDPGGRFVGAMASTVAQEEIETVGGHMSRASGSQTEPIRFHCDPGFVMPWSMTAELSRAPVRPPTLRFSLPRGYDSTHNTRIPVPGEWPTFSALAHYVPELRMAWLFTHERPWVDPIRVAVSSVSELATVARAEYNQLLDAAGIDEMIDRNLGYPTIRLPGGL